MIFDSDVAANPRLSHVVGMQDAAGRVVWLRAGDTMIELWQWDNPSGRPLPEDYVPDVHLRLILYKRISAAETDEDLRELQVELIDRFGLLPGATKNLMRIAGIKRRAAALGVAST